MGKVDTTNRQNTAVLGLSRRSTLTFLLVGLMMGQLSIRLNTGKHVKPDNKTTSVELPTSFARLKTNPAYVRAVV